VPNSGGSDACLRPTAGIIWAYGYVPETRGRQPEALAVHDIFACADRSVPHDARHSQSLHRSGVGLTWSWGGPLRYTRCRYDAHIATIMLL
jgi:hypothetical protein